MIPSDLLHQTKNLIEHQLGWDFGSTRARDFENGLCSMAREMGIRESPEGLTKWLNTIKWTAHELDVLTKYLTVGETYFFRENSHLELFINHIIPELILEKAGKVQTLKIWSAGCCTGEEAYSLAILLNKIVPDLHHWKIVILGTDINRIFLEKAIKGVYSAWSFRETPEAVQQRYFKKTGNNWEVVPEIRQMVSFSLLNLAENSYPSHNSPFHDVDVIFCRNVLMYFTPGQIRTVAHRFFQTLNPKGWLIPSAVELNNEHFHDFATVNALNCIVYRKIPNPFNHSLEKVILAGPKIQPRKATHVVSKNLTTSAPLPGYVPKPNENPLSENKILGKTATELFHSGDYPQCIASVTKLLENGWVTPANVSLIVKAFANLGNLSEAHKWGLKLLSLNGTDASHYYLMATILMEMNDAASAGEILKRALYFNPHHLLSQYMMGMIAVKFGKGQSGKKHFKNVMEILEPFQDSEVIPEADGLTAGRLREMVRNSMTDFET